MEHYETNRWRSRLSSWPRGSSPRSETRKWHNSIFSVLNVVLFSAHDKTWKLSDFGFTSECSSSSFRQSECRRGTPGYLAPELLLDTEAIYNKTVDIWAMGCIFYQLANGQKLFATDDALRDHYRSNNELIDMGCSIFCERATKTIGNCLRQMIRNDATERASVGDLL